MKKLSARFFDRNAEIIAKKLLGKVLVVGRKKARIVETEAYFDEHDPASRASKGDNKVHRMMREKAGKILVYNVHKYKMLNFVCNKKGKANAVLIRAVEPINFSARCNGPGLLTSALGVKERHHGQNLGEEIGVWQDNFESFKIGKSNRIGVTRDLKKHLRFFIKGNKFVSR